MEESMYRKKAMQIESTLLNKIAAFGQSKLSKLTLVTCRRLTAMYQIHR